MRFGHCVHVRYPGSMEGFHRQHRSNTIYKDVSCYLINGLIELQVQRSRSTGILEVTAASGHGASPLARAYPRPRHRLYYFNRLRINSGARNQLRMRYHKERGLPRGRRQILSVDRSLDEVRSSDTLICNSAGDSDCSDVGWEKAGAANRLPVKVFTIRIRSYIFAAI